MLAVGFDASCAAVARPTGVGVAVTNLARALRAVGAAEGVDPRVVVRWSRLRRRRFLLERAGPPVGLFHGRWSLLLARGLDVFHGPDARLPDFSGPALVATVHDLSARRPGFAPDGFRRTREAHWADVLARADRVVTYTQAVKDEVVRELRVSPAKVDVVPLAAAGAAAPSRAAIDEARRRHAGGRPFVLALGERSRRKNAAGAVRALAASGLADHALLLVGPDGFGHEEVDEALRSLPGVAARVARPGWLPDGDAAALLHGAAALLFPTRYEGFGLPVLEAFAAGVPVVASLDPSVVEVAGGPDASAALHADAEDADGLGLALARAVRDDALRADLVARGRTRAAAFTWEGAARALCAVYRAAGGPA